MLEIQFFTVPAPRLESFGNIVRLPAGSVDDGTYIKCDDLFLFFQVDNIDAFEELKVFISAILFFKNVSCGERKRYIHVKSLAIAEFELKFIGNVIGQFSR